MQCQWLFVSDKVVYGLYQDDNPTMVETLKSQYHKGTPIKMITLKTPCTSYKG